MAQLNTLQLAAADAPAQGVIRVSAGAGTGKTTLLLERCCRIYEKAAGKILILAFNKDIAAELRVKIEKLRNPWAAGMTKVFTSHGFAYSLVQQHANTLNLPPKVEVVDTWKILKACRESAKNQFNLKLVDAEVRALLAAEAWRRNSGEQDYARYVSRSISLSKALSTNKITSEQMRKLNDLWMAMRRASGQILFMDMITLALELPDSAYEDCCFRHVLVDEAQDLSTVQHQLVARLRPFTDSLTFVGDKAQAIYEWSGARPDLFDAILPTYNAVDYPLTINYRSTDPILELANRVLELPLVNTSLRLQPPQPTPGTPIHVFEDSGSVMNWLDSLVTLKVPYEEMAIIFRARSHTLQLELDLASRGIPYTCSSGSFFDHPVPADFLSWYRVLLDLDDKEEAWTTLVRQQKFLSRAAAESSYAANPKEPWTHMPAELKTEGQRNTWRQFRNLCETLQEQIATETPLSVFSDLHDLVLSDHWAEKVVDDPDLEREYKQMITGMIEWVASFSDVNSFLESYLKRPRQSKSGVTIISTHKAKGLEWPYVAIWSVGNGTFPLDAHEPEELRLLYVAVTRAQKELVIFKSHKDKSGGKLVELAPENVFSKLFKF